MQAFTAPGAGCAGDFDRERGAFVAYRTRSRRRARRHPVRTALLVLVLLAGLLFAAVYAYSRATGLQGSWWERTTALFHTVAQQIANLAPGQEDDPVAKNPYDASDFYQDGGYVRCTASPVSRTGIDVSSHQGAIDWQAVADAGIEFAIIRVGYRGYGTGTIEEDTSYYTNIEGALAAGLQVGVYFYSQAITTAEAREEAQFVLNHLGGYEITYPVIFDWEQSSEAERTASLDNTALTDCAIAFCDTIEALGYRAGCYFNQYFGYDRFDLRRLDDYCLWLAEYNSYPSFLYNVQLWQYSQSGQVPGIDTAVDLNLCLVDFAG